MVLVLVPRRGYRRTVRERWRGGDLEYEMVASDSIKFEKQRMNIFGDRKITYFRTQIQNKNSRSNFNFRQVGAWREAKSKKKIPQRSSYKPIFLEVKKNSHITDQK